MGLFQLIWNGLTWLGGLLVPVWESASNVRGWAPKLRWPLHFLLMALILGGLGFLNYAFDLDRVVRAPLPFLRKVWLPLLFLLVYIEAWLGWWLWCLLGPDHEVSDYPDIDAAWKEAVQALDRAGIELRRVPLYLVLGRPAGPEEFLFHGGHLELLVHQIPRGGAPLHVYGNLDGVYVTCAGASLLGRQAALLAGELDDADDNPLGVPPATESGPSLKEPAGRQPDPAPVAGDAKPPLQAKAAVLARPGEAVPAGEPKGEEEKREVRVLFAQDEVEPAPRVVRKQPSLVKDAVEVERWTARLKYLCRLIARDREPSCPANGILMLVPFAATDNEVAAGQTGTICQLDALAAREALQVECPMVVVVCDLEKAQGCREFVERFPEEKRERRMGKRFPFVPDMDLAGLQSMIQEGVRWICSGPIPPLVYRLMRPTRGGRDDRAKVLLGNVRLYQFMNEMRQRQEALIRILTRAVLSEGKEIFLFSGCYFAATGKDAGREQGFVAGIFQHLLEGQNFIAWTSEALAEEADYRWWTRFGYVVLALFGVLVLALLYYL